MKKVYVVPGLALVLLACLAGGYEGLKSHIFDRDPPAPRYPKPHDLQEARLQDLDYMEKYLALDRSYSPATRAQAEAMLAGLRTRAGSLNEAEFELAIARVSALADNAHSNVLGFLRAGKYPRIPVRTYWFSDGFYIVRAITGYESLLGGRIVAVDGHPMKEVETALRPYVGGPNEYFHAFQFSYLFEFPALMHAAGITGQPDAMTLTLAFADGHHEDIRLTGERPDAKDLAVHPYYMLSRAALPGEQGWSNLLQRLPAVDFTLQSAKSFLTMPLPDMQGYYLRYWSNSDVGNTKIADYNDQVESALNKAAPLKVIVLDLRNNRGGNYESNRSTLLSLGKYLTPDGHLYIVTGRDTFSAGMFAAAFAKTGAAAKARIIGSRVGDRDRLWAEDNRFTLPNSGIRTYYALGLHNMTGACGDIWKCYWDDYYYYRPVKSLDPDIPAPFDFADYAEGHDPVMEKIQNLETAH